LALMSKGPVALVQTALPFAAFLLWRRLSSSGVRDTAGAARRWLLPAVSGALVMAVVGLTWYAWAASRFAGAKWLWLAEATRVGADGPPSGKPWYEYAVGLYHFLPWLPWLAAGAWLSARTRGEPRRAAAPGPLGLALLLLLLLLLPLVVMSFFRDRFTRYLAPLAPAGALLAAGAIARCPRRTVAARATVAIAAATLAGQVAYFHWLSAKPSSRSTLRPVAEQIRTAYPDAELYAFRPGGRNVISVPADDLSIHLDRTVNWSTDPGKIPPSGRPQVFVVYRTKRPGDAVMAPPAGWRLLAKPRAAGNEDRYVFVRPVGG
jgi:4-amino-4-deoxy-L-arabinose transferase-like glycosyltransferase